MKTSKKTILTTFALVASLAYANAANSFIDDFDRADTNGSGGGLGSNWDTVSTIFINGNVAKTQTASNQFALYNGFELGSSFDISMDAYAQSGGRYIGIIFNYTDSDNYYEIRAQFQGNSTDNLQTSAWQFLKQEGGTQTVVDSGTISPAGSMPVNTFRTISLSTTATTGEYLFTVTDVSETTTYLSQIISDSSLEAGGQAGFKFSNSFSWVDNYSVSSIPEPETYALLFGVVAISSMTLKRRLNR